jgi:hypothetical protein
MLTDDTREYKEEEEEEEAEEEMQRRSSTCSQKCPRRTDEESEIQRQKRGVYEGAEDIQ